MAADGIVELEDFALMMAASARHNQADQTAAQYTDSHYPVSSTLTTTHTPTD
jgi:hypothetical protein